MKTSLTHMLSTLTCALALMGAATAADAMAINEKGTTGTKGTMNKKATNPEVTPPASPVGGKVKMVDFYIGTKAQASASVASPGPVREHSGDPHEYVEGQQQVTSPRDVATGLATGKAQPPASPAQDKPKTGHVTLNR